MRLLLWCLSLGVLLSAWPLRAQTPAAGTPQPAFDVMEYVVSGNSVLSTGQIERALSPFLGPGKTFKDVELAREALENAYQSAGFLSVVVSLPNQRIDSQGDVMLDVTEAKIESLKITGAKYQLPSKVREAVPSLAQGSVPYFPQMQSELAQVQNSNLQVTPLISAGSEPDRIQVELKMEDRLAVSGSIELNSRQSFNTERGRIEASASYGNLFQRGHRLGMSWQYAPTRPSDANTLSLMYEVPLSSRDSLSMSFTNSASDTPIGTAFGGTTLTRGQFYGLRWQHDLEPFHWPVVHSVTLAVDYKNNKDSTVSTSGLSTAKPALRYPVLSLGYDMNWQSSDTTSTALRTSVATSTRALAGRTVDCEGVVIDQFSCKRSGARPDFLVWKLGLNHRRVLLKGWSLEASADAQLASGPLASGEQFSLGGVDTVRGYFDYEQSGDQGWNSRIELTSPAWFSVGTWRSTSLVFADRGFVMLKDPLAGQQARVHLGSYGLGLRLENAQGLQGALDVAMPVFETSRAADSGDFEPATEKRARWELSVRQSF